MGLSHSSYFRDFCFEKGRQLDLGILRIAYSTNLTSVR